MENYDMTFREKAIEFMTTGGLSPEECNQMIERYDKSDFGNTMINRWDDRLSGYKQPMHTNMFIMTLKTVVLKWIDETCPLAWFRAYYTPDPMAEIERMKKERKQNDKE